MASVRAPREQQLSLVYEILTNTRKYNVSYTPQAKANIQDHLDALLLRYTSLTVKYEDYTYNDGRTVGMIKLTGTIPIMYVHVKYNIPVTLWISERYPQDPPIAYVNPTPSMVIKRDHAYVGTNGIIQTPYFARWRKEMSDLVGAVGDMVEVFGQEPPLFAKVTPPPVTQYPAFAAPTTSAQGYNPGSNSAGNPAVYNPRPAFQPPTATATYSAKTESGHSEAVATVERVRGLYRETLIKALFERANRSVMSLSQDVRSKTSKSEEDNAYLKQRAQQIQTGIAMLQEERQTYEHNVQTMAVIVGVMTDWKNKAGLSDVPAGEERKAEDVIVPQDPLAAQQLKAQSEDLAAEDCLNALDKLLLKDRIDLDSYLKQIRQVCRVQYFARALTMKIGEMHHRPH